MNLMHDEPPLTIKKYLENTELANQHFRDPILHSLYLIKQDKWEDAHNIAQDIPTKYGSLVHGLLHRIEGDSWNAAYWYRQAGEQDFLGTIEAEWRFIVDLYFNQ